MRLLDNLGFQVSTCSLKVQQPCFSCVFNQTDVFYQIQTNKQKHMISSNLLSKCRHQQLKRPDRSTVSAKYSLPFMQPSNPLTLRGDTDIGSWPHACALFKFNTPTDPECLVQPEKHPHYWVSPRRASLLPHSKTPKAAGHLSGARRRLSAVTC